MGIGHHSQQSQRKLNPCCAHSIAQVGDILFVPEKAFTGPAWKCLEDSTATAALWEAVGEAFRAKRVARAATIGVGDKFRSSRAELLRGTASGGWVTVKQNGVRYGFDVTRCMFSSGNITEKLRVAKFKAAGEVVVDLFCGIGYWTLPLLVRSPEQPVTTKEQVGTRLGLTPVDVSALPSGSRWSGACARVRLESRGDTRTEAQPGAQWCRRQVQRS